MVGIHVLGKHRTCRTESCIQRLHLKGSYIYVVYEYLYIFTAIKKNQVVYYLSVKETWLPTNIPTEGQCRSELADCPAAAHDPNHSLARHLHTQTNM